MLQQNLYLPDAAVKQEPISPRYGDLASPSAQHHRYTPSPNQMPASSISPNQLASTSMSLNIPIQQQHYDMGQQYPPSVSPLNANMLNLQYQTQANNQTHSNIPNASIFNEAVAAANFLNNNSQQTQPSEQRNIEDIFMNNNLNDMNQLDNVTHTNHDANLDTSSMNISSLLNLDSQNQINSSFLANDLTEFMCKLDNAPMVGGNQDIIPIMIDAMQTNQANPEEENMTDSFKNISIE